MDDNTKLLLEKIKAGEEATRYFQYSDHTLYDLEEAVLKAEYIKLSQGYRIKINKTDDIRDIAILGIECIVKMTGDKVFLSKNLKKVREIHGASIRETTG